MSYSVNTTRQFDRSLKKCIKRGYDMSKLRTVIEILASGGTLPSNCRPHKLSGEYAHVWECHIAPDWLLLWTMDDEELTLLLVDTGTHSDIF